MRVSGEPIGEMPGQTDSGFFEEGNYNNQLGTDGVFKHAR
jgi:hypothetical protein